MWPAEAFVAPRVANAALIAAAALSARCSRGANGCTQNFSTGRGGVGAKRAKEAENRTDCVYDCDYSFRSARGKKVNRKGRGKKPPQQSISLHTGRTFAFVFVRYGSFQSVNLVSFFLLPYLVFFSNNIAFVCFFFSLGEMLPLRCPFY